MLIRISNAYNFRNTSGEIAQGIIDGAFTVPKGLHSGKKKQKMYVKFPTGMRTFTREMKSADLVEEGTGFSFTLVPTVRPRLVGNGAVWRSINPKDFPQLAPNVSALVEHGKAFIPHVAEKKLELDLGGGCFLKVFKKAVRAPRAPAPRPAAKVKDKGKGKKK